MESNITGYSIDEIAGVLQQLVGKKVRIKKMNVEGKLKVINISAQLIFFVRYWYEEDYHERWFDSDEIEL